MPRLALLLALALAACDGDDGIVGTWEPAGAASGGLGSRTTFFADGSARIVTRAEGAPDEAYDARYTVSGDTLLTLADDAGAERFRLRVARDTLVLTDPRTDGRTVLVRVRG